MEVFRRVILSCVICVGCREAPSLITRVTPPAGVSVGVLGVEVGDAQGISGAAIDAHGQLWAVTERQRQLLRLQRAGDAWVQQAPAVVLEGLASELETESLAWLGPDRFLLGTETGEAREHDVLLVMKVDGERARVERHIQVDYAALGITVADNHGVEGACVVGDVLVLALEARRVDGTANVLRHDLKTGRWTTRRVRMTTPTGKLASLDCTQSPDALAIDVIAIERHYGVGRLLAFSLSSQIVNPPKVSDVIVPRVLIDLANTVEPLPNFESVVVIGSDVIAITDNHHGRVTGPTQALRLSGLPLRAP